MDSKHSLAKLTKPSHFRELDIFSWDPYSYHRLALGATVNVGHSCSTP